VDEHSPSLSAVLAASEDPGVQSAATRLSAEVERMTDASPEGLARLWQDRLKDARAARTRATRTTATSPAVSAAEAFRINIERQQAVRSQHGDNRMAIPKPGS
jgi:hypothetical protein